MTTTYNCTKPKNGWESGSYQIGFQTATSKLYAIWFNRQWCISEIKSKKKALKILNEEFESVNLFNN